MSNICKKLNIAIVGVGYQAQKEYLPFFIKNDMYNLVAVCDIDTNSLNKVRKYYKINIYTDLDKMLSVENLDIILLSVPHNAYLNLIKKIVNRNIHIIKEKPFATSIKEAIEIENLIIDKNLLFGITLQRRFHPLFQAIKEKLTEIGDIYLIDGIYGLNIERLDEDWRSSFEISRGGALLDMGYHMIDLIIWYFGLPNQVTCRMGFNNRINQNYDVEDSVNLNFEYIKNNKKILGRFLISRILPQKIEKITIYGTKANLSFENSIIYIKDLKNNIIEKIDLSNITKKDIISNELMYFSKLIIENNTERFKDYKEHFQHLVLLESAYCSDKSNNSIDTNIFLKKLYEGRK